MIEHVKDIRTELNAIADGAEGRRAFEHCHWLTMTCEGQRGREPPKSPSND
jgi:hypothetical protein